MNSSNSKTSDSFRLPLNLLEKIDLRRSDKYVALSNLSIYYTWKKIKISYESNKLKHHAQHGVDYLIYLMDHILYQIFKIISATS